MILTAGEGLPMTVSSFTRMLHRGVSPSMRERLGAREGVGFVCARARVGRLLHVLVPSGDSSGLDRAFPDGRTGRLLEAAWLAQPGSVRDRWRGDVAFGGGFAAPAGRRPACPSVTGGGGDGWFVKGPALPGDRRHWRWGYQVQFAVVVPGSSGGWVPGAVVGARVHQPGLDPRPLWLGMLTDVRAIREGEAWSAGRGRSASSRAWPDAGRCGPGSDFEKAAWELGYRMPAEGNRREVPSGAAGRARVEAEAALARAGASRQGSGSSLAGMWGTSLVVAGELAAWNLSLARRGDPGQW